MEHADTFALIYPHGAGTVGERALKAVKANPRYVPPRLAQPSRTWRKRRERESTEPLQNPGASALDYLPSLSIGLGDSPRTDKGLIFGSNPNCDVSLDIEGISNVHFSLAFDEFNRPIIKDLNSLRGTQVTYNGEGKGVRRDFHWIVGGHDIPQKMESIIVSAPNAVSFQIVILPHDIRSSEYVDSVNRFRQGTATTEDLLEDLGLSYPPTRGAQTPGTGEINLRKRLGEGAYGVVTHLWNVSTGEERVVKTPSPKAIANGQLNHRAWEREAYIMGLVSHERIVRLVESFSAPHPEIHLEYVPLGSLDEHRDITYEETLMIVHQCSSALAYLHGLETPIAHRDIKPANILVESRSDDSISVKLADFGLSRHSSELMTFCGTYLYLAPEVYSDMRSHAGYTKAVDIWSLGVVACRLLYGLPRYKDGYKQNGVAWCEKVVTVMQRNVSRQPTVLGSILVERNLLGFEPQSIDGLTSSSYCGEGDQETFMYALQSDDAEDLSTVIHQPRSTEEVTPSLFVRSGAPQPESLELSEYNDWQGGHEMTHFVEDYSTDPLNPLYVGSSLASQLGRGNSEEWESQFPAGSSRETQDRAEGLESCTILDLKILRSENAEWQGASGPGPVDEGNAIDAGEYDEKKHAALLLQALGQGQW
ncbi:protein kinase [Colletotrichum camelliae]|nr:protein kinase [Colletotrichum camelliae]